MPGESSPPEQLHSAMRYATLAGGKRLRPLLVYASGHALGVTAESLDHAAAAVEMIHAYSLIHDDLPAMDDDALRRGRPTLHVAFDEATAILAGDALQAQAFLALANAPHSAEQRVAMIACLAAGAGSIGMAGGQALDLAAVGQQISEAALMQMHAGKTGALIRSAVTLGALAGSASTATSMRLDRYAEALGLAFQIRDDLLDVEGDSATLGKTAGKDAAAAKPTYVSMLGSDASRQRLALQSEAMQQALRGMDGDVEPLRALARLAAERNT